MATGRLKKTLSYTSGHAPCSQFQCQKQREDKSVLMKRIDELNIELQRSRRVYENEVLNLRLELNNERRYRRADGGKRTKDQTHVYEKTLNEQNEEIKLLKTKVQESQTQLSKLEIAHAECYRLADITKVIQEKFTVLTDKVDECKMQLSSKGTWEAHMEDTTTEIKSVVDELKEFAMYGKRIDDALVDGIKDLKMEINQIKTNNETLNAETKALKGEIQSLNANMDTLHDKMAKSQVKDPKIKMKASFSHWKTQYS